MAVEHKAVVTALKKLADFTTLQLSLQEKFDYERDKLAYLQGYLQSVVATYTSVREKCDHVIGLGKLNERTIKCANDLNDMRSFHLNLCADMERQRLHLTAEIEVASRALTDCEISVMKGKENIVSAQAEYDDAMLAFVHALA